MAYDIKIYIVESLIVTYTVSKELFMNYILPWIIIKHMQGGNISINLHNTLVASGNSLGDIGWRFANWSIIYFNVVLDCSGPL